jgi:hypothetical protein
MAVHRVGRQTEGGQMQRTLRAHAAACALLLGGTITALAADAPEGAYDELVGSLTIGGCQPFVERSDDDPFSFGALAAIHCHEPAAAVRQLALFGFPDADSIGAYWERRIARVEPGLKRRERACAGGSRGVAPWAHGEVACYVSKTSGEAKLRWTDERTHTYGVIDASDRDTRALYGAWMELRPAPDPVTDGATAATRVLELPHFVESISLAIDDEGARHLAIAGGGIDVGDLWYATDRGGAWTTRHLLTGKRARKTWVEPSLAIDTDRSIHIAVVHACEGCLPGGSDGIFHLTDKGRAPGDFGPPVKVSPRDTWDPSLAVADGVRQLAYRKVPLPGEGPARAPVFVGNDRAGSWQTERLDDYGRSPRLRIGPDGRAHVAYSGEKELRYAKERADLDGYRKPVAVPGTERLPGDVSMTLDDSGRPGIAWGPWKKGEPPSWLERTPDGWSDRLVLGPGRVHDSSLDAAGRPHILVGRGSDDRNGQLSHYWLGDDGPQQSIVAMGVGIADAQIEFSGDQVTIAWSQRTEPEGVWVTDRELTATP